MCTIIEERQKGHPKIAKKDIVVYKVCSKIDDNKVRASYYERIYRKNALYNSTFSYTNQETYSDNTEGFTMHELGKPLSFVAEGFHAFTSLDKKRLVLQIWEDDKDVVCKFIIPKGAKYYQNIAGNIVSNQIIFKEILNWEDIE